MPVVFLLGVGVMLITGVAVVERAIRRTSVGALLLLVSLVLSASLTRGSPAVTVAGAKVSVTDLVTVVLIVAGVCRLLRRQVTAVQLALVGVAGLFALSALRGAATIGIESSVNDFRIFMRFFGTAIYFSTAEVTPLLRQRLGRTWLTVAAVLTPILLLRWGNRLAGIPIGILNATYDAPIRVLDGPDSFFYAQSLLIALPATAVLTERDNRRQMAVAGVLLALNLLLNRRTVFVALLVALGALFLRNPGVRRRLGRWAVLGVLLISVVAIFGPEDEVTTQEVGQSATDTGTLEWRIDGWRSLVSDHVDSGPLNVLIGQPMGSGYERTASDREVESNPHNWYLQVALRGGVVGLVGLVALYAYSLLALAGPSRRGEPAPPSTLDLPTLWALLVCELVWYMTWQPNLVQGMVLGIAVSTAASLRRRRTVASPVRAAVTAAKGV